MYLIETIKTIVSDVGNWKIRHFSQMGLEVIWKLQNNFHRIHFVQVEKWFFMKLIKTLVFHSQMS